LISVNLFYLRFKVHKLGKLTRLSILEIRLF
jgi:hypothetical protein